MWQMRSVVRRQGYVERAKKIKCEKMTHEKIQCDLWGGDSKGTAS